MKVNNNKILNIVGLLIVLLFTVNSTVYAQPKITQENELKFTDSAQEKINLIQSLVTKGGISVSDGSYVIIDDSQVITNLDIDTKSTVSEYVKMYNDGISLGIFEIDSDNYLISSTNYEKTKLQEVNKTNTIMPMSTVVNIDSIMKANANTLYSVWYMNISTYGSTIGAVQTGLYFASKVRSGGDWDYKLQFGSTTSYLAEVDGNTEYMTGEDIGNAHYGYVGRKIFSASLLRSAAGAYQIYSGTSYPGWYNTYFDDPNDQYWINRGISYSEGNSF